MSAAVPPNPYAEEVNRHTVIAEAKVLIKQLDTYLALIGEWALEDTEEDVDAAD